MPIVVYASKVDGSDYNTLPMNVKGSGAGGNGGAATKINNTSKLDGVTTARTNLTEPASTAHIYHIIDPDIYREIIGPTNKLVHVKPQQSWATGSEPPDLLENNKIKIKNDIYIDVVDNDCGSFQESIQQNIDNDDYSQVITNVSEIFTTNYIHIIKIC